MLRIGIWASHHRQSSGDYRFETDQRVLYVRGGGDPFLISEELAPLATDLVAVVGKAPIYE
jgi:D-alanyl-D-alanine carboxypeptidase/D-alanyl-D-alanine-endopeptidase (penicillin-binding protein 4)